MDFRVLGPEGRQDLERVLGYLNFSSGATDPQFLASFNRIFGSIADTHVDVPAVPRRGRQKPAAPPPPTWRIVAKVLQEKLAQLRTDVATFQDAHQATAVLEILCEHLVPAYRQFHQDLLFHQTDDVLCGPLMLGRFCEAILAQRPPWNETDRITAGAIRQLNDYIGHRPVASLESEKIEPYPHEWVRPVPLYIEGAGVAVGRYHDTVETTLQLLRNTDEHLLHQACFDPELLEELAIDPRSYDFDHPVNKRPNYHFGQWDPHHIDNQGRYRRFVIQQVTLDALMQRVEQADSALQDEYSLEAAAVLAGTILMAAGISGRGPDTYDSDTTLTSLLPIIASYRDAFYEKLLADIKGPHAQRLRQEALERQQPFGGGRQHLNAQLARCRAVQIEHVQLAKVFARMGYPEAASRQIREVPVAGARMVCQIDCNLAAGRRAVATGNLTQASQLVGEIIDLLQRAVQCGAVIDPWNILGFDANFSLFPALENSVHDHRADDLVALMEQIFGLYSRIWSEAAAIDDQPICEQISTHFQATARWWHQFAAHQVSSVEAPSGMDAYQSALNVAKALNLWHKGGAEAGDVAFWAPHVEVFDSPKAYCLVIEALLERGDFVASMGLLIHWLGRSAEIPLQRGDSSFFGLALRWVHQLLDVSATSQPEQRPVERPSSAELLFKFLDYLEANAEQYWHVPDFHLANGSAGVDSLEALSTANGDALDDGEDDDENEDDNPYSAAYEGVVFRDSTEDGIESQLFDRDETSQDEFENEGERIVDRLAFLDGLARTWRTAALALASRGTGDARQPQEALDIVEAMRPWARRAQENQQQLLGLLQALDSYPLPRPAHDAYSLVQYDRHRLIKESLLEQAITTCVETSEARQWVQAAIACLDEVSPLSALSIADSTDQQQCVLELLRYGLSGQLSEARGVWPLVVDSFANKPILYVPLSKGGQPRDIVSARVQQRTIQNLLVWLPRMGMIEETCELIETVREVERLVPVGRGAVTEFDELFEIGYRSLVECLVRAAQTSEQDAEIGPQQDSHGWQSHLVSCLEQLTESLLVSWLSHSRTLRLSVLEKVSNKTQWQALVDFISTYGSEIFSQHFLNLGNVRAILHQGVNTWLENLQEESDDDQALRLLAELDEQIPRDEAVEKLTVVLEAIVENYAEYRDYNSTTTQSDRGELLYTLLDFLRLRSAYERVVWNLRPVVLAHEILVRSGRNEAAQMWRRALSERIGDEADRYLKRLAALQDKHAMRMTTVADRLGERFLRPMVIDRMKALVEPAMQQATQAGPHHAFELLEEESELLMKQPSGAGLDVPSWLVALEDEVQRVRSRANGGDELEELQQVLPPVPLTLSQVEEQLDQWEQRQNEEDDEEEEDEEQEEENE